MHVAGTALHPLFPIDYPRSYHHSAAAMLSLCLWLQVYLIPRGSDGKQSGSPVALPPISTAPSTLPPQLAKATGVDPIIGPSGFNIAGLQQDAQVQSQCPQVNVWE